MCEGQKQSWLKVGGRASLSYMKEDLHLSYLNIEIIQNRDKFFLFGWDYLTCKREKKQKEKHVNIHFTLTDNFPDSIKWLIFVLSVLILNQWTIINVLLENLLQIVCCNICRKFTNSLAFYLIYFSAYMFSVHPALSLDLE